MSQEELSTQERRVHRGIVLRRGIHIRQEPDLS
jgi:hypothetical protein